MQIPNFIQSDYGDNFGAFVIPHLMITRVQLRCIVGSGKNALEDMGRDYAWDHVSVSCADRCPTWDEMSYIKDIFFAPEETVVQFHPPKSEYVNYHPHTLHLWRPLLVKIPLPPKSMVGPKK
jgi:hypothetical protein